MMVPSFVAVECSAKIAMSALRDGSAAMRLLRDRNHSRRIFPGSVAAEFVNQNSGNWTRRLERLKRLEQSRAIHRRCRTPWKAIIGIPHDRKVWRRKPDRYEAILLRQRVPMTKSAKTYQKNAPGRLTMKNDL
jgi:hypothetical protein